jgi:hypothetical protein
MTPNNSLKRRPGPSMRGLREGPQRLEVNPETGLELQVGNRNSVSSEVESPRREGLFSGRQGLPPVVCVAELRRKPRGQGINRIHPLVCSVKQCRGGWLMAA